MMYDRDQLGAFAVKTPTKPKPLRVAAADVAWLAIAQRLQALPDAELDARLKAMTDQQRGKLRAIALKYDDVPAGLKGLGDVTDDEELSGFFKKLLKKLGPIAPIIGAVAAPFTGGASLLITTAIGAAAGAVEAREAEKQAQQAAAMQQPAPSVIGPAPVLGPDPLPFRPPVFRPAAPPVAKRESGGGGGDGGGGMNPTMLMMLGIVAVALLAGGRR
jgi:hypothetical protein